MLLELAEKEDAEYKVSGDSSGVAGAGAGGQALKAEPLDMSQGTQSDERAVVGAQLAQSEQQLV